MIVYTVIVGGYDNLKPILARNPEWRYIAVVDDLSMPAHGWELVHISELNPPEGLTGVKLQRWAKVHGGPEYFQCPTIYLDGSTQIRKDITELYTGDLAFKKHPMRNCYVAEGEACRVRKKANSADIRRQIHEYVKAGYPPRSGMFETHVLFRPYNAHIMQFCRLWWEEIKKHTHRDQLSVMKALHDTAVPYKVIPYSTILDYTILHKHVQPNILPTNLQL